MKDYQLYVKDFIPRSHLQCEQRGLRFVHEASHRGRIGSLSWTRDLKVQDAINSVVTSSFVMPVSLYETAEHFLSDVTKYEYAKISSLTAVSMTLTDVLPKHLQFL